MRPVSGEGAADSGGGTPTGVLAVQGDIMAAEAAAADWGAGDHKNAESGLIGKIKVFFLVFFFSPAAGWDCMPTYGRFFLYFFFSQIKVTSLKSTKKEVLLL